MKGLCRGHAVVTWPGRFVLVFPSSVRCRGLAGWFCGCVAGPDSTGPSYRRARSHVLDPCPATAMGPLHMHVWCVSRCVGCASGDLSTAANYIPYLHTGTPRVPPPPHP
jgi:hypothetical protein